MTAGHIAADAVGLIGKRLEGHIVTPEVMDIYAKCMNISDLSMEIQHVSYESGRPSEQTD